MKKIVTVLLIICLVFTLLPDKKSVDAAFVIDDALLITVGALLIASGYAFANRDKVAAITKDCYLKMPQGLKDAVQTMKAIGIITWNPVLMNYLKNYKTDTFNAIMGGLGVYKVGGLADREMHLVKQGLITFEDTLTEKTEELTVSDMTPVYGSGIFVLDVMFVYGGFKLKNYEHYIKSQGGYYSYLDENGDWVNIIYNCPVGIGYRNTSHSYTVSPVYWTFFLNRGLSDMKLLYGERVLDMKTYRTDKSVVLQMWNISGVADKARLQYRLYEVEDDYLTIDDMVIYEPRVDISEDDVVFGDAMEGMQDMVITVPQLADVADLVNVNTGVLEGVEVGVRGIYGVLQQLLQWVKSIGLAIAGLWTLITTGLIGDPGDLIMPNISVETFSTKFPFSLPWDLKNAISSLAYTEDMPEFELKWPDGLGGNVMMTIGVPQAFGYVVTFIRAAFLLIFMIGLVYLTPKLLGGAK